MSARELPRIGELSVHESIDSWLVTPEMPVPLLGGPVRFTIDGLDEQEDGDHDEAVAACIEAFAALDPVAVRREAGTHVRAYYESVAGQFSQEEREDYGIPTLSPGDDVWEHVQLGNAPIVQRDPWGPEQDWFVALESECDWEPEHGLLMTWRRGGRLARVSPVDGHLTNRNAWDDDSIPEDAIWHS